MRIFFIRASGLKGLPFTMPIAASWPSSSGLEEVAGSICTNSLIISKYEKSFGGMVLNDFPLASTNFVGGIGGLTSSRTLPSSAVAMLVPYPPGVYG